MKRKATSKKPNDNVLKKTYEQVIDSGKDVDDILEDTEELQEDVEEIKVDVDEIKEDVDKIISKQNSLIKKLKDKITPDKFSFDDLAQQIVGAVVLSAPLAVTEEVWSLSSNLNITRLILIILITLIFDILLIYFTKYQAVENESLFNIIPTRLVSLLLVSYLIATLILTLFGVIGGEVNSLSSSINLIIFIGLFANIGAGAADMLR
jgi:uncharacterized membrane protein